MRGCGSDSGQVVAVPAALEAGAAEPSAGGPALVPPGRRLPEARPSAETTQLRGRPSALSVGRLKKRLLKASQLISEKINGIEGTKLDDHFIDMERKIYNTNKAVTEIRLKATEYIQPNPVYRAKLGMLSTVSKIHNQGKALELPQPEGLLGNCMLKYGHELGEDSSFGGALIDMGKAMKLMAEVKESFDINVKETFIDPLQLVHDEDLREIAHHLKRLEGRRLDYDYKRRRVGKIPDDEITQAMEKFEESKDMAERSMFNFLENDVEQVGQLAQFVQAALDYHQQSADILQLLQRKLRVRIAAASSLSRNNFRPRPLRRCPCALNMSAASSSRSKGCWHEMDQAETCSEESGSVQVDAKVMASKSSSIPEDPSL
ncbi:LOW QUALITY PROTEIN: endophilin-A3-like [Eptesicus fuscus]|uniref:LOW QUALITY PROTEIN: endophilin-A3-like n=1 Tax=Eptesicus fuscus TaxID=29078 RepID=UPI002403BC23|nr:LOW QUALITY PROTEIN: endophilin-A3-like [Eptesicus fuscus]